MQYKEYLFTLLSPTKLSEDVYLPLLSNDLAELGFDSFVEQTNSSLIAYLPERNFEQMDEKGIYTLSFPEVSFIYTSSLCPEKNWNRRWEEESFTPIEIGTKLFIRTPLQPPSRKEVELEIFIQPACSFGTGEHATTWLMLNSLLIENLERKKVLDVGCGTGLLGILALLRGAQTAIFIDIDRQATANTIHNIGLNAISSDKEHQVYTGILEEFYFPPHSFDVICANIHRNIILHDAIRYRSLLNENGNLFISGFLREDEEQIKSHFTALGFVSQETFRKEEWSAMKLSIAQN
ncbi:50S ribosomal protein L11 methyltransferase [Porphyromonas gingivicanis]|uniref:50S ribosomal protein L11 methyltransferase n=1 Tax=Porphyromonas gingivicanis TaxID=266762 RepID=UPI00046F1A66|nr:50S ribosomal protein L11 methyltransferase [Porphyromonas gingivicanis]